MRQLRASDIMHRRVVVVGVEETLRDALALMTEHHVSGLPVVDKDDRCVGLISASDILNFEQDQSGEFDEEGDRMARYYNPETEEWEDIRVSAFALEEFGGTPVGDLMSREVISVPAAAKVTDVAACLVENNIHRVLVLNEDRHILGIISALDLVRILAR